MRTVFKRRSLAIVRSAIYATLICTAVSARAETAAPEGASGDDSGGLQEVVVTAQKRSENLQQVPLTVSAVTAETLEAVNVNTALDLYKVTPSIQLAPGAGVVVPFLRGMGSIIEVASNDPSVALYIDGVYYSHVDSGLLRINSIDRIETLYGPQGTLFGRNASAGLIQIITKDPLPGADPSVKIGAGYSNFKTTDANFYGSVGLGPKVGADVAIVYRDQADGWGTNTFSGGQHYWGRELDARTKFLFQFTDDTQAKVSFDYEQTVGDFGIPNHYFDYPQGNPFTGALLPTIGIYDSRTDQSNTTTTESYGGSIRIAHDFGFGTLSNLASVRHMHQILNEDTDASAEDFSNTTIWLLDKEISEELQFASAGNSRIQYVGGLDYFRKDVTYTPAYITGLSVAPLQAILINGREIGDSYAAYTQGTAELMPKLKLTLGGRYSVEHISGYGNAGPLMNGEVVYGPTTSGADNYTKFSFKAALDYQFTPDLLGYVSVSRGYKAANFNILPFSPEPTQPEGNTDYEVGLKSEWFENHLRLNTSAYYYDITNPQVENVPSPGVIDFTNGKAARDYGLDADLTAAVTSRLEVRAGLGLIDAKYTDYNDAPFFVPLTSPPYGLSPAPLTASANGKSLPFAPKVTFNVGASYKVPSQFGEWLLSSNYYRTSGYYFEPDNEQHQPQFGLLDAQVAYKTPDGHFKIRAYGSNLTNKQYYVFALESAGPQGYNGSPGAPRTYGMMAEYDY